VCVGGRGEKERERNIVVLIQDKKYAGETKILLVTKNVFSANESVSCI